MSEDREVLARMRAQLAQGLPDAQVTVAGGSGRFQVDAVCASFGGLSAVKRQQAVYRCINDLIREGSVHAVTINARTPEEAAPAEAAGPGEG